MMNLKKSQYRSFSELYSAKGDYKKSLEYYIKFSQIKDSLFNVEKLSELTRKEMNFEFDKREADIKQENDITSILMDSLPAENGVVNQTYKITAFATTQQKALSNA